MKPYEKLKLNGEDIAKLIQRWAYRIADKHQSPSEVRATRRCLLELTVMVAIGDSPKKKRK